MRTDRDIGGNRPKSRSGRTFARGGQGGEGYVASESKGAGPFGNYGDYTTIMAAILDIPQFIDDDYVVSVMSDGPYDEEVDIFKLNPIDSGFVLTVEAGDTFTPVVRGETRGFFINPPIARSRQLRKLPSSAADSSRDKPRGNRRGSRTRSCDRDFGFAVCANKPERSPRERNRAARPLPTGLRASGSRISRNANKLEIAASRRLIVAGAYP